MRKNAFGEYVELVAEVYLPDGSYGPIVFRDEAHLVQNLLVGLTVTKVTWRPVEIYTPAAYPELYKPSSDATDAPVSERVSSLVAENVALREELAKLRRDVVTSCDNILSVLKS